MSNHSSLNNKKRWIRWDLGNPKIKKFDESEFDNYLELEEARERNKNGSQIILNQVEDDSKIIFPDRNIWIGSLTFPLMKSEYDKINKLEGIELFKVPGTYTILVGVGVMFNDEKIKKSVESVLRAENFTS